MVQLEVVFFGWRCLWSRRSVSSCRCITREKSLARCVDSLLNQEFRDFELILMDDGSKDRSGEICDGYARADARVGGRA